MMRALLFTFALLFCATAAQAKPLVADLSSHMIEINARFTGTRLLLFGARNDPGDLVVVVRGPTQSYIVRKKSRVGGIWVNRDQVQYDNLPDFYAIASTRPLSDIKGMDVLQALQLGAYNLPIFSNIVQPGSQLHQFAEAFLRHKRKDRLYSTQTGNLTFMGETLFKTSFEFPDNIPRGTYTAEVYLISDGELVSMQSTPIHVSKVGFDAFLYDLAHQYPALYGFLAVALAVSAGWGANALFRRAYA